MLKGDFVYDWVYRSNIRNMDVLSYKCKFVVRLRDK